MPEQYTSVLNVEENSCISPCVCVHVGGFPFYWTMEAFMEAGFICRRVESNELFNTLLAQLPVLTSKD